MSRALSVLRRNWHFSIQATTKKVSFYTSWKPWLSTILWSYQDRFCFWELSRSPSF